MTANTDDDSMRRAIEGLEELGLSAYAARTFVALVHLGVGTAKDVSETVEVPRTRVYDAAEELSDRDLVEVESTTPRQFRSVPIERVLLVLGTEYTDRIDDVTAALESVGETESSLDRADLWHGRDGPSLEERRLAIADDARQRLLFATDGTGSSDPLVAALRRAAERGVSVRVAGVSDDVDDRLDVDGIESDSDEGLWDPEHVPLSTVLIADDEDVVVTFESGEEQVFWSVGESNTLLALLRSILDVQ